MNKDKSSRILISGTSSGSGKTTITCGLLHALNLRKVRVSSFKCGPDYIDPMFHEKILSTPCNNIDSFFMDNNTIKNIYVNNKGKDLSIIEGVMGYYDGTGEEGISSSTYEIASILSSPVVLVINCKGISTSILAILKGFKEYKKDSRIKGVILNNITKNTFSSIKEKISAQFSDIKVVGYVPKLPEECILESRHLGLVTANEINDLKEKMDKLASILEETIDFDVLMEIASSADELEYEEIEISKEKDVCVGVAKDNAFCFYYDANIKLLEKMGAKIKYFSPLNDDHLPNDIDGLYIGGGYPELYLERLEENVSIKEEIKCLLDNHIPCIAECGGFMYLNSTIDGFKMVDYFHSNSENKKKLNRFGYVTLNTNNETLLLSKGESVKAHEFHYYDLEDYGNDYLASKKNGTSYNCCIANENIYAGYPHIHFYSNIDVAKRFINKCFEWREKQC